MGASCLGKAFFGGGAAARQASAVDIFNGETRTFDPTPPPLSAARSFLATVALPAAGLVLFGGGELAEDEKLPSASKDTAVEGHRRRGRVGRPARSGACPRGVVGVLRAPARAAEAVREPGRQRLPRAASQEERPEGRASDRKAVQAAAAEAALKAAQTASADQKRGHASSADASAAKTAKVIDGYMDRNDTRCIAVFREIDRTGPASSTRPSSSSGARRWACR